MNEKRRNTHGGSRYRSGLIRFRVKRRLYVRSLMYAEVFVGAIGRGNGKIVRFEGRSRGRNEDTSQHRETRTPKRVAYEREETRQLDSSCHRSFDRPFVLNGSSVRFRSTFGRLVQLSSFSLSIFPLKTLTPDIDESLTCASQDVEAFVSLLEKREREKEKQVENAVLVCDFTLKM